MIGIPIAWAVTVLLLALFENVAQTRLVNAGLAIRPVLAQAAESLDNKQNISLEAIVQVTSFQSYVAKKTRLANALIHALCALSLVACLSIIVVSINRLLPSTFLINHAQKDMLLQLDPGLHAASTSQSECSSQCAHVSETLRELRWSSQPSHRLHRKA